MGIIERYISRELLLPFFVVTVILIGLFVSFSVARFLTGAVAETLGAVAMFKLVALKTIIALEVLVPIAFYVAVIHGLSRMNRDQEINVLRSVGYGDNRIIRTVFITALPIAILSGILSIYARPWAYAESYVMNAQAEAELNTDRFQPGRFYGSEKSGRVIFIRGKDDLEKRMEGIFHYIRTTENTEIIVSQRGYQQPMTREQWPHIELLDGKIYRLGYDAARDSTIQFEKMIYFNENDQDQNYRRKAASTQSLWSSGQPREIAELQWRLSRPVATILLALIAVSFTRTVPRKDKTDRTFIVAALVFAVYYNLSGLAKTWVEQEVVAAVPGIWWVYGLLFIVVMLRLPEFRSLLSARK
ncbi:LPS export ABC transporter permease LptF [Nitrosomonas sp. HPC101]|uniref:LPS export ABC transporter permease LptF n=1 Tax=Nitrosomonas sp. HPC101 TaxID=1658667 RepID=UPI00136B08C4|nr:LPS export ABC transporter permease LptF [Nitrosomonas sp. HPC101]MXS84917.1 LPS export ABC transporter permease LptF [Nitrosomonas sp. HPC101]